MLFYVPFDNLYFLTDEFIQFMFIMITDILGSIFTILFYAICLPF